MTMAGRPTTFTEEIAAEICARLAQGETLPTICADEHMPDRSTEWRWRQANEAYCNAVARAREERAHAWAEDCVEIADDGSRDYKEVERNDGSKHTVVDTDHIQRSKLRVETRLKIMAKHAPASYGDKLGLTGPDGKGPVEAKITVEFVKPSE